MKSSLILIRGSIVAKTATRDLTTAIVSLVKEVKLSVIWKFNAQRAAKTQSTPTSVEILKQLVLQSLQLNAKLMSEQAVSINASRFQAARSESEWFDLLGSVLVRLPYIFITIDVETLGAHAEEPLSWPAAFMLLFQKLEARKVGTIVKVILVSYHENLLLPPSGTMKNVISVISIGKRGEENILSPAARKKAAVSRFGRAPRKGGGLSSVRPYLLAVGSLRLA